MPLKNGTYRIKSFSTGYTIGTAPNEDRSDIIKNIELQCGSRFKDADARWQIEDQHLRIGGEDAGILDSKSTLRHVVVGKKGHALGYPRKWTLRPAVTVGMDLGPGGDRDKDTLFNICISDGGIVYAWTIDDSEFKDRQILVLEPLQHYNQKQIFRFVKVDDEDEQK